MVLSVITPDGALWDAKEVDRLSLTTEAGYITILPEHTPLASVVVPCELEIHAAGQEEFIAVGQGLLRIEDNKITVLVDTAVTPESIDEQQTEEARKRAEEALADVTIDDETLAKIQADLSRALAKLQVVQRMQRKRQG